MYKVNKQKCTGCQVCIRNCPGATKIGADGKAEVINQEKLEQCGGESVCPFGAIEEIDGKEKPKKETLSKLASPRASRSPRLSSPVGRRGIGRGLGRGRGPAQFKRMGRRGRFGRRRG